MNKGELVEAVRKGLGKDTARVDGERAVTAVLEAIKAGLKKDKSVQLVGFGTFRVAERKARDGVHPKTLEKIRIKKSKTVKFLAGKDFKGRL
jgi:DNA-binding protein HU-beta